MEVNSLTIPFLTYAVHTTALFFEKNSKNVVLHCYR